MDKYRINTNIGDNQKLTVELKQDFDLLEILSLKISQSEIYTSICSDYGVICGRITANNGFGIENAKISIFIPKDENLNDEVINNLYPYSTPQDLDENGYRYNLLPNTKQHSGHVPVGTFPSPSDLNRSEIIEVYEKYYNYTVKTNSSGDFMIWGVPVGVHTLHVDIDLSDIGCFSLRPYDFIRKGYGVDNFDRLFNFKSDTNINGLPQIVSFDKTIEVYPFWGDENNCFIGITRNDFDLSEVGIKIEPISLLLASSFTDDDSNAIKKNGVIRRDVGNKCSLQTSEGKLECVRFTKNYVKTKDGKIYPELEYFSISETIDENGAIMAVIPMNREFVITNEYGEQVITNDTSKGIPTSSTLRFKFSLNSNGNKTTTASYLVPNIREFNPNVKGNLNKGDVYNKGVLSSYIFSDVFEDYINPPTKDGLVYSESGYGENEKTKKESLILGTNNNGVPEDYFYKFTYGKVYTISSFQSSHYEVSNIGEIFGTTRRDAFLGIKGIKPPLEDDCTTNTNYFPINFAYRNRVSFKLILNEIVLLLQYFALVSSTFFIETFGRINFNIGLGLIKIGLLRNFGLDFIEFAYKLQESSQRIMSLSTYPDCEECSNDIDNSVDEKIDIYDYCRVGELKMKIIPYLGNVYFFVKNSNLNTNLNISTNTNSTFLPNLFPDSTAKSNELECQNSFILTTNNLTTLGLINTNGTKRFVGQVYDGSENDIFNDFTLIFSNENQVENVFNRNLTNIQLTLPQRERIYIKYVINSNLITFSIVDSNGSLATVFEDVTIKFETNYVDCNFLNTVVINEVKINNGQSVATFDLSKPVCSNGNTQSNVFKKINSITTNYPIYTPPNGDEGTLVDGIGFAFSFDEFQQITGIDANNESILINYKDIVIRIFDREFLLNNSTNNVLNIEQGCEKYDTFYDETNNQYTFLWGTTDYGVNNNPSSIIENKLLSNNNKRLNSNYNDKPNYTNSNYIESNTQPSSNHTLLATLSGSDTTFRLPNNINLDGRYLTFVKKTKSGLTEIRDGVITLVPVIRGKSNNTTVIKEWYKRKRIALAFCGGVINYSFIDNWLHGIFHFFKFNYKLKWNNFDNFDLDVRKTKYPRELVFFNILDNTFYYRSTPFDLSNNFKGQVYTNYKEILRPTTIYDVGLRDTFMKEICFDEQINNLDSVVRDITPTSYQDPTPIVEYAISNKLDITNNDVNIEDFFQNDIFPNIQSLNGDLLQLFSINSEVGIEAFDMDSVQYQIYNNEFLDPENNLYQNYFKQNNIFGPIAIDFKLDNNGKLMRETLNFKLSNNSQVVPFYLWDKYGEGFGAYNNLVNKQRWDKSSIASMKLQKIKSVKDVNDLASNYAFSNNYEEYLLKPMTITHNTFYFSGNTEDSLERFEMISFSEPNTTTNFIEGDLWLKVNSGTIDNPISGSIYVMVNNTWVLQPLSYISNVRETFLPQTKNNYIGNKQVLSTPFMFYFGLRPNKTSLDLFMKYYGTK